MTSRGVAEPPGHALEAGAQAERAIAHPLFDERLHRRDVRIGRAPRARVPITRCRTAPWPTISATLEPTPCFS